MIKNHPGRLDCSFVICNLFFSTPIFRGSKLVFKSVNGQHLSDEKNPGWLGYVGDYTTQFYREYDKHFIRIPINQPV